MGYKRIVETKTEDIYGCSRCKINEIDNPYRMCPCHRGGGLDCEAVGSLKSIWTKPEVGKEEGGWGMMNGA